MQEERNETPGESSICKNRYPNPESKSGLGQAGASSVLCPLALVLVHFFKNLWRFRNNYILQHRHKNVLSIL